MAFDKSYQIAANKSIDKFTQDLLKEVEAFSSEGLEQAMDESLTLVKESMEKYVPIDTEATKNSWFQYVEVRPTEVVGVFGHDREGKLDYVPFIYLGINTEGNPINFNKDRQPLAKPMWLEQALLENIEAIRRKLSNTGE